MGFIAVDCPSCGANLTFDDSREFAFCEYCGSKIVQDKKVIEVQGSIEIEGIATADSLLERGYLLLEEGSLRKAEHYFNRVCDINPRCSKAYWGMLLCQLGIYDESIIYLNKRTLDAYPNYQNAVRFSEGEERKKYLQINELITMRIQHDIKQLKKSKVHFGLFALLTAVTGTITGVAFSFLVASIFVGDFGATGIILIPFVIFLIPTILAGRKATHCRKTIEKITGKKYFNHR